MVYTQIATQPQKDYANLQMVQPLNILFHKHQIQYLLCIDVLRNNIL